MPTDVELENLITRREAIRRVSAMLGGVALIGGTGLLTACDNAERRAAASGAKRIGEFKAKDIVFLDEVADTILPTTAKSPGAKAAKTGAFMALMVTDSYAPKDQEVFREGMRELDRASQKAYGSSFVEATPQQRLDLLIRADGEQYAISHAEESRKRSEAAQKRAERKAAEQLPDQRQELAGTQDASSAAAMEEDPPRHYFRMMKELALLGFFTSEIGCTQAQRYVESPGQFDPCASYTPGEPAWAPHA